MLKRGRISGIYKTKAIYTQEDGKGYEGLNPFKCRRIKKINFKMSIKSIIFF